MFGDGSGYLNDGCLLKSVGADHAAGDLSSDSDHGDAVEECVGEATDQVSGTRARGSNTDTGEAGGARVALGSEDATLLVAREDVADGGGAREGLVDLHGCASRVGEYVGDALAFKGLHEDIRALSWLIRGISGDESLWV